MEKGDIIVGRISMNPIGNKLTPCIELLLFDGLSDGELVLLEVKNCRWVKELTQKAGTQNKSSMAQRKDGK